MATDPSRTFGDLLRAYRMAARLTQQQLAELAGVSWRTITSLERGIRRSPYKPTVHRLCDALQLNTAQRAAFDAASRHPPAPRLRAPVPISSAREIAGGAPPLTGRDQEVVALVRHLAGTGPTALFLAGEPGIGKSRLLAEAAHMARARGWQVLQAGCHPGSALLPYAPILDALKSHLLSRSPAGRRADLRNCAWLVRLLPELEDLAVAPAPSWSLPPNQERRLMFEAVGRLLANVASPAGILLLLDDLQWAGSDGLDLLATIARASLSVPLRVVGAYRDTEVSSSGPLAATLADLAAAGLADQVALGPLAPDKSAELLTYLLAAAPPPAGAPALAGDERTRTAAQLAQRTGGVPFFLVSCAQDALQAAASQPGSQARHRHVPWSAAQSIRQRTETLPAPARDLLRMAAIVQGPVPHRVVLALADPGQSEAEVVAALDTLVQARLLLEADAIGEVSYCFAHDLIRDVVEAGLSSARRALLHRKVAAAFERQPGPPLLEALAYHYALSGDTERAVDYLERAGDAASSVQAHAAAQLLYQQLLTRLDTLGRTMPAATACEKLGDELVALAQYAQGLQAYQRACAVYEAAGDRDALCRVVARVGHAHARQGTPSEGLARVRALLAADPAPAPSPGLALLHEALAHLCSVAGHFADQLAAAEAALKLATALREERLQIQAEFWRADALDAFGHLDESLASLLRGIARSQQSNDLWNFAHMLNRVAYVYQRRGEFARSMPFHARALAVATQVGDPADIAHMLVMLGMGTFYAGEWDQGRAHIQRALETISQVGPSLRATYPPLALALMDLAQGRYQPAQLHFDRVLQLATGNGDLQALRYAQRALAEHDLLEQRPESARARLEPLLDRPDNPAELAPFLLPFLAWAYLDLGDMQRAEALLLQGFRRAYTQQLRLTLVDIVRVRAMLALRRSLWREARQALQAAADMSRAMPYPHGEIKALYVWGQLHIARGESALARERLESGLAIAQRLGERLYATHMERALANLATS